MKKPAYAGFGALWGGYVAIGQFDIPRLHRQYLS